MLSITIVKLQEPIQAIIGLNTKALVLHNSILHYVIFNCKPLYYLKLIHSLKLLNPLGQQIKRTSLD